MNLISKSLIGASFLALAACGGKGDDALADNVADAYDNKADAMDAVADNMSNGVAADAMEEKADAMRETGEQKEDAIDDSDVNAAAMTADQKNAMATVK
jgi:hypothetical protein